ncbi:hypothetical protein [Corynebacterium hindlerae]|uniref:hypothetical protein n=1 Tax=Corynebacterium hindlerae TaxID=699041 RepID=UPI003AAE1703
MARSGTPPRAPTFPATARTTWSRAVSRIFPDKMYRFEVRTADTDELVYIARSKVGAYGTARRLRLQGIQTNIFLGTWERV